MAPCGQGSCASLPLALSDMATAMVTGSGGLTGSETARALSAHAVAVAGINNDTMVRDIHDNNAARWARERN